jgi:tetratricopeptide (TPR) repeat protein
MQTRNFHSIRLPENSISFYFLKPAITFIFVFLMYFYCASMVFAEGPKLAAPYTSVKAGNSFSVKAENVPADSEIIWEWDPFLECNKTDNASLNCRLNRFVPEYETIFSEIMNKKKPYIVRVKAQILSLNWQETAVVTIDSAGGRRPKQSGWSPESQKLAEIKNMLDSLKDSPITHEILIDFFKQMGDKGYSIKDLIAFKDEATKGMEPFWGKNAWDGEYGFIERELIAARRIEIIKARERVLQNFYDMNPHVPIILMMDIGGWVTEGKDKMRFEGDIDFTFTSLIEKYAIILRDMFENEVKSIFKMDMIQIDALATAHRFATHSVYKGRHGADWAEIDAVRGKIQAVLSIDGTVKIREATSTEKILHFAILKNNIEKKLSGKDNLDEIIHEKEDPKPKYDMEPGISMEFLRHTIEDALHTKMASWEMIIRIAKYLDRSCTDHAKFLAGVKGMELTIIDEPVVKAAGQIMALKQFNKSKPGSVDKFKKEFPEKSVPEENLSPEQTLREILNVADNFLGKDWSNNADVSLKSFGDRAVKVLTHNIEEGVKARELMIDEKEASDQKYEADEERKRFLSDLTEEYDVFKHVGIEFPKAALDAMSKLQDYFKNKLVTLPAEEQEKLKELLEKAAENPNMARMLLAMVQERIRFYYKNPKQIIPAFNNFLDTLDNKTVEKIRDIGEIKFEVKGIKIHVGKEINIKAINGYLNTTVLGKVGQSQAFQAINLGMELQSYYDAVMNSENWKDSFSNLSTEFFRRRVPAGSAFDAYIQGNYIRTGIEIVYTIFPVAAIPEGLYGLAYNAAEWSVGTLQQWQYDDMINEIFKGARFEKTGNKYEITSLSYKCPSGGTVELETKEAILKLPDTCPGVYHIIIPQIKNHPVLMAFQEMLDNKSVSSGRTDNYFPYKWDLMESKYGQELYKTYRKKVDDVVLEYFKGLVEKLEKAKAWASGSGYVNIIRIEMELGCTKPLVQFKVGYFGQDDILGDAERFQKIADDYTRLRDSTKTILGIKEKWQLGFPQVEVKKDARGNDHTWVSELIPECSSDSIYQKSVLAQKLERVLLDAVQTATHDVQNIAVADKISDFILEDAIRAALCMAYYKDRNRFIYSDCEKQYQKALEALKEQISKDKQAAIKEKAEEDAKKKEVPACSYKYSDWGECNRGTKKQTRTVIASEPQRCAERDKPALEQGCTPPPTEEEKRRALFNCICRCGSGIVGAGYHPEPGGDSPSCADLANGPCTGGDWGCFRWHMPSGGECVSNCYESFNMILDSNAKNAIMSENKKHMKPLKVELKPDKTVLQIGDVVNVYATVSGGIPGYKYSWIGKGTGKENAFKFENSRQPGSYQISVTVIDSIGNTASDSVSLIVETLTVKIEKLEPKGNSLPLGGIAKFRATVMSGNHPASGDFTIRWEQHPKIAFTPHEAQGAGSETSAKFPGTGTFQIWANALQKQGGTLRPMGESEQISIQVVKPKITLKAEPKDPLIGEEVKITVEVEPDIDESVIDFWWEIAGNALNPGPLQNNREYTFRPKDSKPVTVTVHARSREGDDLGSEKIIITAKSYKVSITEPRPRQKLPMWKCDTQLGAAEKCGMVEMIGQFTVDQEILMDAVVTPKPEGQLNYQWSVSPEGCSINPFTEKTSMQCSNTGTYTVKVSVNAAVIGEKVDLGQARHNVSISISQEELKKSNNKKAAAEKLAKAKELAKQGKLDEAIKLAEEALKLDPNNSEAADLAKQWKEGRDRWNYAVKLRSEGEALEKQNKLEEAIAKYRESMKYLPDPKLETHIKQLEDKLADSTSKKQTADRLWSECTNLYNQKRMDEALAKCTDSLKNWPDTARQDYMKKMESAKSSAQKHQAEGDALYKQQKYAEALAKYKESLRYWPNQKLEDYVMEIENRKTAANTSWNECISLYNQKRMNEAFAKCTESLRNWPDAVKQNYVKKMEETKAAAKKLRDEGEALQNQGKLQEAANKYKESVKTWPNSELDDHIIKIENKIRTENEIKACAKKWDEGAVLQKQNRLHEALAKYKTGYECSPSSEKANHIKIVEDYINKPSIPSQGTAFLGEWKTFSGGIIGSSNERTIAHTGKLIFQLDGNQYKGTVHYTDPVDYGTEPLSDISFVNGVLQYSRPNAKPVPQVFKGQFTNDKTIEGIFVHDNKSQFYWRGERISGPLTITKPTTQTQQTPDTAPSDYTLTIPYKELTSIEWQFGRGDGSVIGNMKLLSQGRISGYTHPNETSWGYEGSNLIFYHESGKAATRFNSFKKENGKWVISGPFLLINNCTTSNCIHVLREM